MRWDSGTADRNGSTLFLRLSRKTLILTKWSQRKQSTIKGINCNSLCIFDSKFKCHPNEDYKRFDPLSLNYVQLFSLSVKLFCLPNSFLVLQYFNRLISYTLTFISAFNFVYFHPIKNVYQFVDNLSLHYSNHICMIINFLRYACRTIVVHLWWWRISDIGLIFEYFFIAHFKRLFIFYWHHHRVWAVDCRLYNQYNLRMVTSSYKVLS